MKAHDRFDDIADAAGLEVTEALQLTAIDDGVILIPCDQWSAICSRNVKLNISELTRIGPIILNNDAKASDVFVTQPCPACARIDSDA